MSRKVILSWFGIILGMAEAMAPEVEKDIAYYRRTWGFDDTTVKVLRHVLEKCITDDYPPAISQTGFTKSQFREELEMGTKAFEKAFDELVKHGIMRLRSDLHPYEMQTWSLSEHIVMNQTAVNARKEKMEKESGMKPTAPVKA